MGDTPKTVMTTRAPAVLKIGVSSVVSSVISESNVSNGDVIPPSLNVFNCPSSKMTKR